MKKVVFVIWDNPEWFNTIIFSTKAFGKKNFQVHLIYFLSDKKDNINRQDWGSKTILHPIKKKRFFFINLLFLYLYSLKIVFLTKPNFLILFNRRALMCNVFLKFFFTRLKIIYHNFDYDNPININNFSEYIETKIEFFLSRYCNLLVFPEINRGKIFLRLAKIKNIKILEFYNCFPKYYRPKKTEFVNKIIRERNTFLVSRLGSIGPNHYIEELIESVSFWNKNIYLILAGSSTSNEYLSKLQDLIKKKKLENRIKILPSVDKELWFEILSKSKLGICFYKPYSISHQHMAGASTKFNNYLYANIPFLVNKNRDFLTLSKRWKIYDVVEPQKPITIAKSINILKSNKKFYARLKRNGRELFSKSMNFEYQFNKFFSYINKL
jgi:glycosyltransferase involved in cell wall biosynthesis